MIVDIIFSFNIYQPEYFDYLYNDIKKVCNYSYLIVVNSNDNNVYNFLKDKYRSHEKILLNPNTIKKAVFHGSILHGIISNMKYIINNNINFKYYIILSNRTNILPDKVFCKWKKNIYNIEEIDNFGFENIEELKKLIDKNKIMIKELFDKKEEKLCFLNNYKHNTDISVPAWHNGAINNNTFHWNRWSYSLIYKYFQINNYLLYSTYHEGLFFDYNSIKEILAFFENNIDLLNNTISFNGSMEEFVLQTLCANLNLNFANIRCQRYNFYK